MIENRYDIVRLTCTEEREFYTAYPSTNRSEWLIEALNNSRRLISYEVVLEDLTAREMVDCMLLANRNDGNISPEHLRAALLVVRELDGEVLSKEEEKQYDPTQNRRRPKFVQRVSDLFDMSSN